MPATLDHPAKNVPVPKYPEAAKKDDKAGREAAAKYFMSALAFAQETGSKEALDMVSYPECPECWLFQSETENFYENGGWVVPGGTIEEEFVVANEPDENGQFLVQFRVVEDANILVYASSGRQPKKEPKTEATGLLWVQFWPEKGKNVVFKYQTLSLKELK